MADFLFHEVSEKEKEDIKKQAKGIMDSFAKKLESIESTTRVYLDNSSTKNSTKGKSKLKEAVIERDVSERQEGSVGKCRDIDRAIMFANALEKNDNSIIAEKKAW